MEEARKTTTEQNGELGYGGRFTANDDGRYFQGVLVDLEPESGYAYKIFELKED